MSRKVTEAHIDAVMVQRGWARLTGRSWGDGPVTWRVVMQVPMGATTEQSAYLASEYERRRDQVRRQLENEARGAADPNVDAAEEIARRFVAEGMTKAEAARQATAQMAARGVFISDATVRRRMSRKK